MSDLKHRFKELFEASGWSQAEAARKMEMTRGGLNGIVTGATVPNAASVKLLEMLLLQEGKPVPGKTGKIIRHLAITDPELDQVIGKIEKIFKGSPEKFSAIETMVLSVYADLFSPRVNSSVNAGASKLLKKASASVIKNS